jgi:hypothetical protein
LESQNYSISGFQAYGSNAPIPFARSGQDPPLASVQTKGIITYGDSPGLPDGFYQGFQFTSGAFTGQFNLTVSATSGTQVVSCGTVPWTVNIYVINRNGYGMGQLGF